MLSILSRMEGRELRILFTVQPATGHLNPLIPVAEALVERGNDVAFCSAPLFRREVETYGFDHFDAGLDWLASDQSTWSAFPPMPPPGPEFARFVVAMFADITTRQMVPDLLAISRDWKPDLIIREGMEYGGCIAAECMGLPHASIAGNAYAAVDSPAVGYFPGNRRLVAEPLDRHRAEFGLAPDPEVEMPFRFLHLCFMPPSWSGGAPAPANTHYLRHTNPSRGRAELPRWVDELPDRPTLLASLGTVFNKYPGVLEAIVEALRDQRLNAIVAIGEDREANEFGPQPAHVRLEHYVPQTALLSRCSIFITHGGFNSVKEALVGGIPLVVIPITADQPYSAARCAALGVAKVIEPPDRSGEAVAASIRQVLSGQAFRANAKSFQGEMLGLPGPDKMTELLELLAVEHRPLPLIV
jgi:hypothetical protein